MINKYNLKFFCIIMYKSFKNYAVMNKNIYIISMLCKWRIIKCTFELSRIKYIFKNNFELTSKCATSVNYDIKQ